jgi:CheY-like chemotaxis protein
MTEPSSETGADQSGPTVLVIDDDELGRALLSELLIDVSARIIALDSAIGATRLVGREQVDVVVLDVQMPNLRGDVLAQLFRNNARIAHVGVVLVSGCSPEELEALGKSCGADQIVSKGDLTTSLASAVRRAWETARARALRAPDSSS